MYLQTASKIAWRDLRAAPAKFFFVTLSVAVGVAALSGVKGFGYAFQGMLLRNAKQLLAADVQGQTWNDPTPEQAARIAAIGRGAGNFTSVVETVSMARSGAQRIPQMVAVKGVEPAFYPFYGKLTVDPDRPLRDLLPDDASVVVTPELLTRLRVKPGDSIRLGGMDFRITGTIVTEPDRLASGFGPGMRVLMTRAALEHTGLLQYGSRASRRFLIRLNVGSELDRVREELKASMPRIFISDYREGSPAVGRAIENTTTFLSLISLIALIVGSLGVATAMHSHLQQRMDTIATFKAVGARSGQIIQIYLVQTLWLGLLGGLVGVAVGAAVQRTFPVLMRQIFDLLPDVPWDWSFSLQGMALGILATLFFTLPPLLNVRNVRPSLVFRRDMADEGTERGKHWRDRIPSLVGSALIALGFIGIAAWLSNSLRMGLYFIAGLAFAVLVLWALAAALLFTARRLVRFLQRQLPSWLYHGFANLYRPGNQARSILVALGIGVMFTLSTYLLQRTVLQAVTSEGPGREGNLFLLDIRDTGAISSLLRSQPGVTGKLQLVGYIVSRMLSKNGVPTEELPLTKLRKNQLQAVRVTTAGGLPEGLELKRGEWWSGSSADPQLAVSEEAARDFQLNVGDQIRFQIAGRTVSAPVVATFRRLARAPVRYDLVFPREALNGLPVVYYGAAHVDPGYIPQVEEAIFDKFPTITVMNLADILKRIQEAVDQVAVVVRFLALFAIAAGVVILCSSVAGTRYRRIREVAILKSLGGTRMQIARIFSVEFSIIGLLAGLAGGILANAFTRILSDRFIDVQYDFDWLSVAVAVIGTAVLANAAGWIASARILGQRPLEVLRGE
ncbi:MAG: ABC transporter permease [Bryobacteraceae bacterium]